ncbi:TetR family transcriptional regulator [Paenibacillus caui]|uniref:TetR family transcriptional regulator n=1 Tax=Paenibacillus caui TaxID=2873927 RepID=UPI001CA89DF1|nr:TetR family transcriptional regulator [Paenibacillus caui]
MNKKSTVLTKAEILDAAEAALRKYGPDKTSVTDVAKMLKVSHGTLYRHYESKSALKEAVTERWLEQKIVAPLTEVSSMQEENKAEHLKRYIRGLIELKREFSRNDPEMFRMYAEVTEAAADLIYQHLSVITGQLESLIAAGMENGQIRSGDAGALAQAIFHATSRFHHPSHAYEWSAPEIDGQFEQVWDLLARGFIL